MKYKQRFDHQAALEMYDAVDQTGRKLNSLKDIMGKFHISKQAIYDLIHQREKEAKSPQPRKEIKKVAIVDPSLDQLEDWFIGRIAALQQIWAITLPMAVRLYSALDRSL
jgi:predicted DNA-binding protein YlxM (UPF0122 family)